MSGTTLHVVVHENNMDCIIVHVESNLWKRYHDIAILSDHDREYNVPEYTIVPLVGVRSSIEGASLSIR